MSDLFGHTNKEVIRTLGFYEPFCTLMMYGKIETRWVREGRKPPFPKGKYLSYTTKQPAGDKLNDWCGPEIRDRIYKTLRDEDTMFHGYALWIGKLVDMWIMKPEDEEKAFVNFVGIKTFYDKEGEMIKKVQWCLKFDNIWRIEPFKFEFGKQGVGILPESEHHKIIIK